MKVGTAGTSGRELEGGAVRSRLRFGLGPKVAPDGCGVRLMRERLRAKGDGGGMDFSLVMDLRMWMLLSLESRGSTDCEVRPWSTNDDGAQ